MYFLALPLVLLGLASAADPAFPIANDKNCTPGENFIQYQGASFVLSCKKFGRRLIANYAGCIIGGKYVALGSSLDTDTPDNKLGYRITCASDEEYSILTRFDGCKYDGKLVNFNETFSTVSGNEGDYGFRFLCQKNGNGYVDMKPQGCLLAPETPDEIFLNIGEMKFVHELGKYCKCYGDGYNVGCVSDKNYFNNLA